MTQQAPHAPLRHDHRIAKFALVAAISTLVAFVIDAGQTRPLGDDPVGMIVAGCLIATAASLPRPGHPLPLGLAAMAGFPVWAVIDLARNGGHNLLPFELVFYAVYAALGVIVATIVTALRR